MVNEAALIKAVEIFLAVLFGGMLSYFITKLYETPSLEYAAITVGLGVFIIVYFYIWYKRLEK